MTLEFKWLSVKEISFVITSVCIRYSILTMFMQRYAPESFWKFGLSYKVL